MITIQIRKVEAVDALAAIVAAIDQAPQGEARTNLRHFEVTLRAGLDAQAAPAPPAAVPAVVEVLDANLNPIGRETKGQAARGLARDGMDLLEALGDHFAPGHRRRSGKE